MDDSPAQFIWPPAHSIWLPPLQIGPSAQLIWPKGRLPVELFETIADYLTRKDVQSMRLVCKEFDSKVSQLYFRNVVLRFRPGILDSTDPRDDAKQNASLSNASAVVDRGENVFNTFGGYIQSFAFALELSEQDLCRPPMKLNQELIPAPWGFYRWPVDKYVRFGSFEDLEDSADETRGITEALSKLVNLRELGLSCDAGYGYLSGHDCRPTRHHRVFPSSRYEPDPLPPVPVDNTPNRETFLRYRLLKEMALRAGYEADEHKNVIALLLSCEGKPSDWAQKPPEAAIVAAPGGGPQLGDAVVPHSQVKFGDEDFSRSSLLFRDLIPGSLTAMQRQVLLEMMWAQEALIQTLTIAVIDCKVTFSNLTTITIARIPGSLVHLFHRHDFWAACESLEKLSVAVIPDWRVFTKNRDEEFFFNTHISPVTSCKPVFLLLNEFVAALPRLDALHFEWICGGELARGKAQRNRWVLPAPLVLDTSALTRSQVSSAPRELLSLPSVKRLSLKNCWVTPHVFLRVISDMAADHNLTELELETVSMTGCPSGGRSPTIVVPSDPLAPWPLCIPKDLIMLMAAPIDLGRLNDRFENELGGDTLVVVIHPNGDITTATASQPQPSSEDPSPWPLPPNCAVPCPDLLSWAHVLNELTPGRTIEEHFDGEARPKDDDNFAALARGAAAWAGTPRLRSSAGGPALATLLLKNCGYCLVDVEQLDNASWLGRFADPHDAVTGGPELLDALDALDGTQLESEDPLLARVVDVLRPGCEAAVLRRVFGLRLGCLGLLYGAGFVDEMARDGLRRWGVGRFSGGWVLGAARPVEELWPPPPETDADRAAMKKEDDELPPWAADRVEPDVPLWMQARDDDDEDFEDQQGFQQLFQQDMMDPDHPFV
ncbi:uncharacterized protein E0L32_012345 [Thyridium curvatum]|uniref:F-box domain-containing protein n=1 Tax=Thyridium curvatum TaxID=1093900 RepID=A0A507BHZ6_9PEZI|nr:uncharacterized protein E0L32_012345 [Thyridium curvatum]TPX16999.1 hypothetical protein E0L32_012345 [Thyridium curvatum]